MIRINLLPKEEVPRSIQVKMPPIASFVPMFVAAGLLTLCVATWFVQHGQVQQLEQNIETAKEESRRLAPQIARIKQLTKERDEVDRRLDAITMLDKDRYFRVRLMSELSRRMPENTWLTEYEEVGPTTLRMEGITFSNFVIADFMRDQVASDSYRAVDLDFIERGTIGKIDVLKFGLTAQVGQPANDVATGM
jgi:Tfp pilus assembly protein PilN